MDRAPQSKELTAVDKLIRNNSYLFLYCLHCSFFLSYLKSLNHINFAAHQTLCIAWIEMPLGKPHTLVKGIHSSPTWGWPSASKLCVCVCGQAVLGHAVPKLQGAADFVGAVAGLAAANGRSALFCSAFRHPSAPPDALKPYASIATCGRSTPEVVGSEGEWAACLGPCAVLTLTPPSAPSKEAACCSAQSRPPSTLCYVSHIGSCGRMTSLLLYTWHLHRRRRIEGDSSF